MRSRKGWNAVALQHADFVHMNITVIWKMDFARFQMMPSHGNAKLTEDDVISARHERLQNNTSFQKLADKYGVSKHTIQDAVTGKRWAHVVMPEPQKEDA